MEVRKGNAQSNNKTATIEFCIEDYIIYVFQGELSTFDILVKYKKDKKRLRTPKHIHWVTDILMKKQSSKTLTTKLLNQLKKCWERSEPLDDNNFETIKNRINNGKKFIKLEEYVNLNQYGEYSVEFLYVLIQLLSIQEKTNRKDAYMFGKIISQLLEEELDIFSIVSSAGYRGKK